MQNHDTRRHDRGGAADAVLAEAFEIAPAQANAALRAVMSEFAWRLERNTLSRGGLADLVEALGSADHARYLEAAGELRGDAARAEGAAILSHIFGIRDGGHALSARAARAAKLSERTAASMLPALAIIAVARLAGGAQSGLGEILRVLPPLGRWSRGSPHADLADILRRGCGAGPYAPATLRRAVRGTIARAAGFPARGAARWYLQFILVRPIARPVLAIAARASNGPRHDVHEY